MANRLSTPGRAAVNYLRALLGRRYTFEPVTVVEDVGVEPTFDLVVPGAQSFLAKGIVSHNATLMRSGAPDVVVIASVAALVPRAELEGDMGDVHVGLQARLMSQALRKLTSVVHKSKTVLIFINQIRQTIGGLPF